MNLAEGDNSNVLGLTADRDIYVDKRRDLSKVNDSDKSENVQSSILVVEMNRSPGQIRRGINNYGEGREHSSEDLSKINSEGEVDQVHDNISFGGKKMAQVLTLGAGGDN